MARLSFTLRKDELGGSAVQAIHPAHVAAGDSDMALRADDFVYATQPLTLGPDSSFEVLAVDYGIMRLRWEIGVPLDTTINGVTLTELRVVYSDEGTPRSVGDGQTVARFTRDQWLDEYHHRVTDAAFTSMPFAYYSLFGRYTDGATAWYERVASVSELVPRNHGSREQLWRRIPLHYRLLDDQLGIEQGTIEGPLLQFLSLFGFELDVHRTLIQSLWRINDPDFTHESALNALAHQVGLLVDVGDIPAKFVRNVLANYGFLRERKGTLVGIMAYLNALTECRIQVLRRSTRSEDDGAITTHQTYRFMIGAQRANLINTPRFAYGPNVSAPKWNITGGYAIAYDAATKTITNQATETQRITLYQTDPIPLMPGIPYHGMVLAYDGELPLSVEVHDPALGFSSTNPGTAITPVFASDIGDRTLDNQTRELRVTIQPSGVDPQDVYTYLQVTLPPGAAIRLDRAILQPFVDGTYFDGDSELGGFVNDNEGNIAKDYRWVYNRGQSPSVFTEYIAHKRQAVAKSVPFLMPALFTPQGDNSFEFQFNVLPGQAEQLVLDGEWDAIAGTWPPPPPFPIIRPQIDEVIAVDVPTSAQPAIWEDPETMIVERRWVVED